MNYNEALEYIHGLKRFGSKPGLKRTEALAHRLGNPQKRLKFVHIAGTNGKGSTAAFLEGILSAAGYSVGLYTSPYVVRFNERIRLNNSEISDQDLADYTGRVKETVEEMVREGFEHPTEFEFITALAFLYYFEKKSDVVVLETGMGGRFDAPNIIQVPAVSVITKISYDHMEILGDTLSKIAFEKAGIIKPGGNVVTYPQEESALQTIESVCAEKNARLFYANPDELSGIELVRGSLEFTHPVHGRIQTSIVGMHQVYNASVAIKAAEVLNNSGFSIEAADIRSGFHKASWLGRFELLRTRPDFYIDAAHNPDGVASFIDTFKRIYPGKKAIIIFGVMKDKEYETMVRELSTVAKRFIAVTPDTPRALSADILAKVMAKYCNNVEFSDTIREAVEKSVLSASGDDVIVALGSLYYIGEVRELLLKA